MTRTETAYCSFCAKSQHDVRHLIAGPRAYICNECIELCGQIISEQDFLRRNAIALDAEYGPRIYGREE